jgi:hypothetical protein
MSWFLIEIVVALAPFGVLLWWTVRSLRRRRAALDEPDASARDGDEA